VQLKPGYKQTEVGVIPGDWEVARLADVADVKTGPFGSTLHERDYVPDGTPIITVEHLGETGVMHRGLPMVSDSDRLRLQGYSLRSGDIVFSRVGAIDRNALIRDSEDGWLFSGRLLRVRPRENKVHAPFLSYQFHGEPFRRRVRAVAVGQTMASLNTRILEDVVVVRPALPEQRTIADALIDVDALIVSLEKLIAKKRDLKQAAMQELLTGRTRLPGFKGEWKSKRVGSLFQFLSTANNPRADLTSLDGVGYIHYGDIHTTSAVFLDCTAVELPRIARAKVEGLPRVADGDLVMVDASEDYAGLGKSLEVRNTAGTEVVAGLHTFLLRGDSNQIVDGFKGSLQFIPAFRAALVRMATGISVYGVSKNNVGSIEVPLPEPAEQRAIAAVLADMDAEIAALEARLVKTRDLKQGMMQELLTGRTRLV